MNYSAGILPFSIRGSTIYFLLGRDLDRKWSDFGGRSDLTDTSIEYTAAREFYEESIGSVMDISSMINHLKNKENFKIVDRSIPGYPYHLFIVKIPHYAYYRDIFRSTSLFIGYINKKEHSATSVLTMPTVHSVHSAHSTPTVHSVHSVHSTPTVHSAHSTPTVHSAHSTPTVHSAHSVHSVPPKVQNQKKFEKKVEYKYIEKTEIQWVSSDVLLRSINTHNSEYPLRPIFKKTLQASINDIIDFCNSQHSYIEFN